MTFPDQNPFHGFAKITFGLFPSHPVNCKACCRACADHRSDRVNQAVYRQDQIKCRDAVRAFRERDKKGIRQHIG